MMPRRVLFSVLLLAAAAGAQPLAIGQPVSDFELRDLSGKAWRLSSLRPEVVVLEWTSHLCPAVAGLHDTGIVADTRAAVPAEGVRWLMVDSSWFAAAHREGIEVWRDRLDLRRVPYLLDAGGEVAAALGATVTPQVCVVGGDGRLAYRGPISVGRDEVGRRNPVLAAVRALLAGEAVAEPELEARGCGVHARPADGETADSADEDSRATALYRDARAAARGGDHAAAVDLLRRVLDAGYPRPFHAVTDPAFAATWQRADERAALRRLLRAHAPTGLLTMVSPREPGEAMVVAGTVRDRDGRPVAGAEIGLYHTDAQGWYSAGSTSGENPRLAGLVRSDRAGRYRVRTVFPAHYATSSNGASHVHMHIRAEGYRTQSGHPASLFFADDPGLRGDNLREIRSDGCAIGEPRRNAEGVRFYVRDFVLDR